jgi:hypothetical protein
MDKEIGFIAFTLSEAKAGNLVPLIARIRGGIASREECELAADLLEQLEGKRGKVYLRETEEALMAMRVEGLVEEEGLSTEAAVAQVMRERDCSRSSVFSAIRQFKEARLIRAKRILESKK